MLEKSLLSVSSLSDESANNLPVVCVLEPAVQEALSLGQVYLVILVFDKHELCEAKKIARFGQWFISSNESDL